MKEKILVVVDMQNDFIDGSLGTKEAEEIVNNVKKEIEDTSYTKIYATEDTHYEDYLITREGKYLPVEHCIKNTKGWYINALVKEALEKRGATYIEKNTFGSVDLMELIKNYDKQIESITLIGLCTDICVVSNALLIKAALPETDVIVKANCCAGVTPEKHEAALETMRSCQIDVI